MSILIKDTTKEEREKIIAEALGCDFVGCSFKSAGIYYQLYIDGKKDLQKRKLHYVR